MNQRLITLRNQSCFVKPWNSIGNRWCMTHTLSGGAPLFIMCLCVLFRKGVSCSLISLRKPCRLKHSCVKIYFSCLPGNLLINMKPQNYQSIAEVYPEGHATHVVFTMKICSRYRLSIYD